MQLDAVTRRVYEKDYTVDSFQPMTLWYPLGLEESTLTFDKRFTLKQIRSKNSFGSKCSDYCATGIFTYILNYFN